MAIKYVYSLVSSSVLKFEINFKLVQQMIGSASNDKDKYFKNYLLSNNKF